eukprot:2258589-Pyramimonas_sp.AAC.1
MVRHDELYSFGADGVLMELAGDPGVLQHRLSLELQEKAAIQLRVRAHISTLNQDVLMPDFAPLDERLMECGNRVGDFQLVRLYSDHQHVSLAVNGQHEYVVIKEYDKRSVTDAKE